MSKLRWQNSNGDIELVEVNQQWLNEHDEQIRADERAEMLMPYDVESIDELIENVRANAFDEVEEAFNEYLFDSPMMNPIMTRNEILLFLEELKEKK